MREYRQRDPVSFNGAGDLHHRKAGLLPGALRYALPSTEPVIFITGKVRPNLQQVLAKNPSTEPVIFITGKRQRRHDHAMAGGAFNGAGDLHHRKARISPPAGREMTSFNGAGDLHHRKGAGAPAVRRARAPSTEPVIFITGK